MRANTLSSSMKAIFAALIAAIGTAAVTPPAARGQPPEQFAARDIRIVLAIDYAAPKLSGSVTYVLENWSRRPADSISFLLNRLMEASRVRDGSGASLNFSQDVVRFIDDPMRQVTQIRVALPQSVPPGGRASLTIDYGGYLVGYTEIGWLYVKDHIDTAFTIIREDALAFPVIGNLSNAANRQLPYPDFTYEASIRVPSRYMVALGGTMSHTRNADGTTTWLYKSGRPASVMNISIAPFDTLVDNGVRVFYFREDSAGARLLMSRTQAALATYAKWFGPLRSAARLTITEIPDGWGSQASLVGGIIQTASAFRDPSRLGEVYHELSHLWNARDTDSPSPRWNEGLATFLELLMAEKLDSAAGRTTREPQLIASVRKRIDADSVLRTVPFIDYGKHDMTGMSYRVGEIMFSSLYDLLGAAEFNKIVGGYYQKYADAGTARDLTDFAIRNSSRDLKAFFDDWMYTTRWTNILANVSSVDQIAQHYQ